MSAKAKTSRANLGTAAKSSHLPLRSKSTSTTAKPAAAPAKIGRVPLTTRNANSSSTNTRPGITKSLAKRTIKETTTPPGPKPTKVTPTNARTAPAARKAPARTTSARSTRATTASSTDRAGAKIAKQEEPKPKSKAALKIEELEATCAKTQQELEEQRVQFEHKVYGLEEENRTLDKERNELQHDVQNKTETIGRLEEHQQSLLNELNGVQAELSQATNTVHVQSEEICSLHMKIAELQSIIRLHEERAIADEAERRRLHNMVQELKGNVRVFCRVRPFLSTDEAAQTPTPVISCMDDKEVAVHAGGPVATFNFDKVFDSNTNQELVFEEISQLVQSSLDGYNVCVFAYGQTGSGKTYTMIGGDDFESRGMIPRAVEQLFQRQAELEVKGWRYTFQASMLEIYNEEPRDLLTSDDTAPKPTISWTVPVSNLTEVTVGSPEDVYELLKQADQNRKTAKTAMNAHSSRSHSVFRLQISGQNAASGESCDATLNLIDLAGSERIKDSKVQGQEEKEAKFINKSLTTLKRVFTKLAQKDGHVPFRDSKLTMLLKDSMCNNSKCLMFVNVAPTESSASETKNSLRFAAEANKCHLGTARANAK
eukprot:m.25527 g.25527  ORF g.25527 m.25527 type:complete len:599 (+) comp9877_c0_seq1:118-1914(+)